eukprot:1792634-Prymnesium_polylepis.1
MSSASTPPCESRTDWCQPGGRSSLAAAMIHVSSTNARAYRHTHTHRRGRWPMLWPMLSPKA